MVSGGILVAMFLFAIIGPFISPNDYLQTDFDRLLRPPGIDQFQLFGTDDLGRDLFVRSMLGVQVTIVIAIIASFVSLVIGVAYGAIAGYLGGRADAIMMRFVDTLYALPFIFFVILLMVAFERTGWTWHASYAGKRCRCASGSLCRRRDLPACPRRASSSDTLRRI
jgi:oligopeptide transport system permease protein